MTSEWLGEHLAEWEGTLETLRAEGWAVDMMTPAAPVQLEGRVPSGERFYFRARWTDVLLAIGGDDPGDGAPWQERITYDDDGPTGASYLPGRVGLRILRDLHARYSA